MASKFVLAFAALAAVAVNGAVVPRAAADANSILSVTGQGSVDVPTTSTQVSASIEKSVKCEEKQKCTGAPAQQAASKALTNVLDYLKTVDSVSKLTTTNVQLQPDYVYVDGQPPKLTGYKATSSISFDVDNKNAGEVLDQIVQEGITNINSINFVASDEAISKAQDEALKLAVKDAQKQGDAVLSAIGAKSQGISGIQVGSASPPMPVPLAMAAPAPGADMALNKVPTPIEAGTQTVDASVTLNIKYAQDY